MGVLPEAGLWKEGSSTPRSRGNTTPRTASKDAEKPQGRRMFHETGRRDGVRIGNESLAHTRNTAQLRRNASEPSLGKTGKPTAIPASGASKSRVGEQNNAGRLRYRNGAAHEGSVGVVSDADHVNEFRYYVNPEQKRMGRKVGVEENNSNRRFCPEHRFYAEPGQDRIDGLKKSAKPAGSDAGSAVGGCGFEPRPRGQSLPKKQGRMSARSVSPRFSCLQSNASSVTTIRPGESSSSAFGFSSRNGQSSACGKSECSDSTLATRRPGNIPNGPIPHALVAGLLTPTASDITDLTTTTLPSNATSAPCSTNIMDVPFF